MTTTAKLSINQLTDTETAPFVIKYVSGEFKYGHKDDFWEPYGECQYSVQPETGLIYSDAYMFADLPEDSSEVCAYLVSRRLVQFQTLEDAQEVRDIFLEAME